ncbi:gustatory and pheromone receptor 32a-like [Camponotus floridanus]|uniref:gustatory and pheromone receptor 32a-like n=1 Tax=Camponotus floridanus TaxID=104421 RepID=UPI000DC69937|nr:gustatory and pheromone receptor 32a-like [Camponotus floridanus]
MTKYQGSKYLLQIIKQVHLELCKVSRTICVIFGIQISCDIGVVVIGFTEILYSLYIRYINRQHKITDSLLQETSVTIMLVTIHILKIIFLSRVCKHAVDKGNKTIEIIYSIYGCEDASDVQEEIQQFSIQILQRPLKFFAFGISLDNHVLIMILKAVTTYLIVMIQVSNLLES